MTAHEAGPVFEGRPVLDPALLPVFTSWLELGPPCTVYAGLSVAVVDERKALYVPRLAWLTENGYTDAETRRELLFLWGALDLEKLACERERVAEMTKKK